MENVFDVLNERGMIEQCTNEEEIRKLLGSESVTFYIGFDPTADSLHVGHFIQIMVMAHMQRYGHRPIALIGGGTTMIGDSVPMRKKSVNYWAANRSPFILALTRQQTVCTSAILFRLW